MYKRALFTAIVLLTSVLGATLVVLPAVADTEPNDDFPEAETISPGTHSGAINYIEDYEDYYKFGITPGVEIGVSLTSSTNALIMYLYDENENELASVAGSSSSSRSLTYQTAYETDFSYCYLVLEAEEAATYSFILSLTPQNDGGSGGDAPSTRAGSLVVTEGQITGMVSSGTEGSNVGGEDDKDVFKFWAGQGDRINLTFTTTAPEHLYLNLFSPSENYIFQDVPFKIGMTAYREWLTASETELNYYYLEVYQDAVPGYYTITLDIERQNDASSGGDAPGTMANAIPALVGLIAEPAINNGVLGGEDGFDHYKLTAGNGDVISLGFRGYSIGDKLYVELQDSTGSVLRSNGSSSADSGCFMSYYTANETTPATFHIKVWMDTKPGNYVISLAVQRQNDAGAGIDVPGTESTGTYLISGSYDGWLFDMDTADMYKLKLESGQVVDVTMGISEGTSAVLQLHSPTLGGQIASRSVTYGSFATVRYAVDRIVDNVTIHLKVMSGSARYSIGVNILGQNDAGSGSDAGGTMEMGQTSPMPTTVTQGSFSGYLHLDDTTDSYVLEVPSGKRLNVTVEPESTLQVICTVFNATGSVLESENNGPGEMVHVIHDFPTGETVQIVIGSYGTYGNYSLDITFADIPSIEGVPSAPVLAASSGPGKVTLTWTAPADDGGSPIQGYEIFRKIFGSLTPATQLTMVGPSVLTYTDTNVVIGTTYEYFIKAYNANGKGAASNSVTGSPIQAITDTDGDGMPDDWEDRYGLNKNDPTDAAKDKDGDGFTNVQEYLSGSDPTNKNDKPGETDTDGDGIPDWWELMYGMNPESPSDALLDTDEDGRNNLKEYKDGTNPRVKDSSIADDDDDDDDGLLDRFPLSGVGCCIGIIIIGVILLIIVLIVVLILAKGRKKKDEKEEDDVPIAAVEDEEASEE